MGEVEEGYWDVQTSGYEVRQPQGCSVQHRECSHWYCSNWWQEVLDLWGSFCGCTDVKSCVIHLKLTKYCMPMALQFKKSERSSEIKNLRATGLECLFQVFNILGNTVSTFFLSYFVSCLICLGFYHFYLFLWIYFVTLPIYCLQVYSFFFFKYHGIILMSIFYL